MPATAHCATHASDHSFLTIVSSEFTHFCLLSSRSTTSAIIVSIAHTGNNNHNFSSTSWNMKQTPSRTNGDLQRYFVATFITASILPTMFAVASAVARRQRVAQLGSDVHAAFT